MQGDSGRLLDQLNATLSLPDDQPDIEELRPFLRYAVYMRKSSDESSDKQHKSIADQQIEIQRYIVDRFNIDATKLRFFKEEESAKAPNIRPKFNRMIEELRAGKLDGVIAWHPDRLSRNMLEAGIIIDLADMGVIKDMLFVGHQFENNSTGKMMLGILFAISKQYSEHLSESVMRALNESTKKGEVKTSFVHGYRRLADDRLEPDGENFILIKEAFRMRLEGHKLDEIANYLNKNGYRRFSRTSGSHYATVMNTDKVSRILRNTLYAGFYKYGKREYQDLREIYGFIPMIAEVEYQKIVKLESGGKRAFISKGTILADETNKIVFLHRMVTCGHCQDFMGLTINKGSGGTKYGYFRCNNNKCLFIQMTDVNPKKQRHSIRSTEIKEKLIYSLLNSSFKEGGYEKYKADFKLRAERLSEESERSRQRLINKRTALEADKKKALETIKVLANKEDIENSIIDYYTENIKTYETQINNINLDLERIKKTLEYFKVDVLDKEDKFFEHLQKIKNHLCKTEKIDELNKLLPIFYSNISILNKTTSVITLQKSWENIINLTWLGR